ncbi:hypothetical protein OEZ85_004074 [Tetradesmus obliquus]|uniref:Uncharacterized protein n=1 Tax=Tetradesmus obliquus TaxID=3088 RepID=A0ABY8UE57_TETOB|nr:hypothetical protein OEZ85_004074 [Tetradesmus obliquus]
MEPDSAGPETKEIGPRFTTWGSSGHSQQHRLSAVAAAAADGQQGDDTPASSSSPYSPMRVSMASRMAAAGVPNSIASRMPSEQQEAATAVAYVSVNGGSRAGEGNGRGDGSPRTRLRLNHVQPRSPGGQRAAPVLPEFIHVEEDVPPGAAVEDIEIDHLQADEQKRHDDVQQGMIKQVDDLVEYFNSLYQDDQQGIRWASTAACGSVYVGAANSNVTFSIETISNRECTQQHAALAAGAKTASTLPAWTGSAPGLKSSSDPVARVAAAGESAFNLTFSLDAAASIKFLVVHANMYARFGNNYAVYDNVMLLVPVSLDGTDFGTAAELPPFTTAPAATAPTPSPDMAVNPLVGPDRFTIQKVQQDRPGMVHVIVTRPNNQATQIPAGSASAFQHRAATRRLLETPFSRHVRHLLAPASSEGVLVLPPQPGAAAVGSLFMPPCATQLACTSLDNVGAYVNTANEAVAFQKCVPLPMISTAADALVTGLVNDTLYRVTTVHSDLYGNEDTLSALVRTQDLMPPVLTVVDTPPPDFNKFSVSVQLNEPGTVYAGLLLASDQGAVTATARCPPEFTGPVIGRLSLPAATASQAVALAFDSGLVANTDYLLKLIAVDAYGNCQTTFTDLLVHTLDNVPPDTLSLDVANITGSSGQLQLTLNEPSTAYFIVLPHGPTGPGECPASEQLFALTIPSGATLPDTSALGNFSVALANTAAGPTVSGLRSETSYRACVVAADMTRLQNKQPSVSYKDFRTLDVTPPNLVVMPTPGTDGNFTCSRWVLPD